MTPSNNLDTRPAADRDERFRLMANAAPVMMWTATARHGRTWFNERCLAFVQRPLEDEVGSGWLRHVHPDDAARVRAAVTDACSRGEPFDIEYRLRHHDDQYRVVRDSGRVVSDDAGRFHGYIGTIIDITEQTTAAAGQRYVSAILESADEAIIAKDLHGVIQWSNAAAERLFGYSPAELVGASVRMLIPPERQAEEGEILERLRRGERIEHFETVRLAKDGRRLDVALTISPVRDAAGTIVGASKIARDITEQRRAAAAQAYLAAIVSSSDDAIIAKDLDGIVQSCNTAAEQVFGYPAAELVGRPVRILIPADRQAEEDVILARIKRGERVDHFETVRMRKDGRLIDVSLTISPVRDTAGAIIGVSKIARDITAQKRAAAELEAQQAWFRITLASIADAVIATDVQMRVVFMNPVAEHLTGWRAAVAQGRDCRDVFRIVDEHHRPLDNPATRVLSDGGPFGFGTPPVLVSVDGTERPIDDSAAPIRNREGHIIGVVVVFRDISERRRLELERQASAAERERLLEAERTARAEAERASRVKDEFVATVSHELRTPLNAILGWTQLMAHGQHDAATMERGLDVVARNTRLQAQLISDLLDISRIVSGKLRLDVQRVPLPQLVAEAIESARPDADTKRLRIAERLDQRAGVVAGDPARLQQILSNLLSNAVKFTPEGGRIDIELRRRPGQAEISVSDTGEGIAADVLPHVFDRFQQGDGSITRRFGGLGLGLAIVKHLVELHGGHVRATSAGTGCGSTFIVSLPVITDALSETKPEAADTAAEPDALSLTSVRVLIVEDEPDTREFLRRLLEDHGAIVSSASSANEALTAFRSDPPDLLISDIGLPDVDGYDLMRRIRENGTLHGRRTPAIALTAYARVEDRTRALRAGYQAHVAKPVESSELLARIASIAPRRDDGTPRP